MYNKHIFFIIKSNIVNKIMVSNLNTVIDYINLPTYNLQPYNLSICPRLFNNRIPNGGTTHLEMAQWCGRPVSAWGQPLRAPPRIIWGQPPRAPPHIDIPTHISKGQKFSSPAARHSAYSKAY